MGRKNHQPRVEPQGQERSSLSPKEGEAPVLFLCASPSVGQTAFGSWGQEKSVLGPGASQEVMLPEVEQVWKLRVCEMGGWGVGIRD